MTTRRLTGDELDGITKDIIGIGEPADFALKPCPRCKRVPGLETQPVGRDLVELRYVCRRWWGLLHCFSGFPVLDDYDAGVHGRNIAARAWNRAVDAHPTKPRPTVGRGSR